jgi:hypothetical protein
MDMYTPRGMPFNQLIKQLPDQAVTGLFMAHEDSLAC